MDVNSYQTHEMDGKWKHKLVNFDLSKRTRHRSRKCYDKKSDDTSASAYGEVHTVAPIRKITIRKGKDRAMRTRLEPPLIQSRRLTAGQDNLTSTP